MRVWVASPMGGSIPLQVHADEVCKTVKKRINDLPECRTASGAWSIEGWGAPRVYHRGVELHDDQSISDAGIRPDSRLEPAYNSSAYSVLDPAYYGGSSQPMPLTKSPCGVAKDIGEHWEHGPGKAVQKGLGSIAEKVRGAVTSGGVGIEVRQDASSLQFIVESVAPSGAAGAAGVRQGDVITMVGGKGCVDASGLSKLEVEGILSLQGKGEGQTGGWGDWLGGRSSHAVRRIAAVAPPQKGTHDPKIVGLGEMSEALRGVPLTAVTVRYKSATLGCEKESVLWRKDVTSLGASFV